MSINLHLRVHVLGSHKEITELDDMFINGNYTPFFEDPSSKKYPLADATNEDKPAKRRKVQPASSKSLDVLQF